MQYNDSGYDMDDDEYLDVPRGTHEGVLDILRTRLRQVKKSLGAKERRASR